MSAISASSMPQPSAKPLTAAITGMSVCSSASAAGVRPPVRRARSQLSGGGSAWPPSSCLTSSPAQNARSPSPVITSARARLSRTASSSAL